MSESKAVPREGWFKPHVYAKRLWYSQRLLAAAWFICNLHDCSFYIGASYLAEPAPRWRVAIGCGPCCVEVFVYAGDL